MFGAIVFIGVLCMALTLEHKDVHRTRIMQDFYRTEYSRCYPTGN